MAASNSLANESVQTTHDSLFFGIGSRNDMWIFFIKLLIAILVVGLMVFVSKLVAQMVSRRIQENSIVSDDYTKKVSMLISNVIYYTLLVFSILVGFKIIGLDFSLIVGGISFGIGFAFKEIFWNMIAGILVLTNKEFKLGDIIQIDEDEKYFGRIEEITIRYTVIRTLDLRKVIVPNLTLITKPVRTFDSEDMIRLSIKMSIHYNTPLPRGLEVIKDAVNTVPVVKEPSHTRVNILEMADSGINILIYFYFDPKGGMLRRTAKGKVQEAILKACAENGIVIPYPHTTITVDHNDKDLISTALYVAKESTQEEK